MPRENEIGADAERDIARQAVIEQCFKSNLRSDAASIYSVSQRINFLLQSNCEFA
jgi:hypothetical protein